jgi:hypothetical protein
MSASDERELNVHQLGEFTVRCIVESNANLARAQR